MRYSGRMKQSKRPTNFQTILGKKTALTDILFLCQIHAYVPYCNTGVPNRIKNYFFFLTISSVRGYKVMTYFGDID